MKITKQASALYSAAEPRIGGVSYHLVLLAPVLIAKFRGKPLCEFCGTGGGYEHNKASFRSLFGG